MKLRNGATPRPSAGLTAALVFTLALVWACLAPLPADAAPTLAQVQAQVNTSTIIITVENAEDVEERKEKKDMKGIMESQDIQVTPEHLVLLLILVPLVTQVTQAILD